MDVTINPDTQNSPSKIMNNEVKTLATLHDKDTRPILTQLHDKDILPGMPKKKKTRTHSQTGLTAQAVSGENIPIHFCVYRKELNQYVFLPAGYGKKYYSINKGNSKAPFCKECRLQPCLNLEYATEIYGYGHRIAAKLTSHISASEKELLDDRINTRLLQVAGGIVKDVFGEKYASMKGIPRCVFEKILATYPTVGESWYESSDDDDDNDRRDNNSQIQMPFIPPFTLAQKK